jgi:hypothetical protein
MINQQMHLYKYVQSHVTVLHQHVSATSMTIIRVSCNKNATDVILKMNA